MKNISIAYPDLILLNRLGVVDRPVVLADVKVVLLVEAQLDHILVELQSAQSQIARFFCMQHFKLVLFIY